MKAKDATAIEGALENVWASYESHMSPNASTKPKVGSELLMGRSEI